MPVSIRGACWSVPPAPPSWNGCGVSARSKLGPRIKPHLYCRVCGNNDLRPYLDLGMQAPANALRAARQLPDAEVLFPLTVLWCPTCSLSQLGYVLEPDVLYQDYPFRAGVSQKWRAHCEALAESLELQTQPTPDFVLDIGANDGALLEACQRRGAKVLGIDPCPANTALPMLAELWSSLLVPGIQQMHGQPDHITATNVFGHVDDAYDFLRGIAALLPAHGQAVIECPHIMPLLEATAFDTIYHEHLSYWSLRPLEMLAERCGLRVVDVELFDGLHGGTMRYVLVPTASPERASRAVSGLRVLEQGLTIQGVAPYRDFAERAQKNITTFRETLEQEHQAGLRVLGYGASAKGNVLLQAAQVNTRLVQAIVDDTPEKWGLYTPGTSIPIQPPDLLSEADVLVLLSWNNAADLKLRAVAQGFRGRFLVPHPDPHFEAV